MQNQTALEEQLAHLSRAVDDLSDVVARQSVELEVLSRRLRMLMEREAERESMSADGLGAIPLADQKPPHW